MSHFLEFEKPIAELEGKVEELRRTTTADGIDVADEVGKLQDKAQKLLAATYAKLTPWQKAQVARHPERPKALDYVASLIDGFLPLAGDRAFWRRCGGDRRVRPVPRPRRGSAGHREGAGYRNPGAA